MNKKQHQSQINRDILFYNLHKVNFYRLFVADYELCYREVAEWSMAHAWKACILFTGYQGFESLSLCKTEVRK